MRNNNNINFSFLESGDGFVLEVLHTGASIEDIAIEGYIKDSIFEGNFKYKDSSELYSIEDYITLTTTYICIIILSFIVLKWKSKNIIKYLRDKQINSILFYILLQAIMTASLIIPMLVFIIMRKNITPYFLRVPTSSYEVFISE